MLYYFNLNHSVRIAFLSFFVFLHMGAVVGQRATGLLMDDESYAKIRSISPAQNFSGADEPVFSLRNFCPTPGSQGAMGSCVGWSVAYGAYTTALSKKKNITNKSSINNQAYSALFLYNQIKASDCKAGANLGRAFEFLKTSGVCKASEFNPSDCFSVPDQSIMELAKSNRIKSYLTLFQLDAHPENKVIATRKELQHGRPVVIGMTITNSFEKIGKDGVWSPSQGELYIGGHAMCVVGYDDLQEQFEILNSWGPDFGDGGYVYVGYEDFKKFCRYGYTFKLEEEQPTVTFDFKGSFYLNKMVRQNKETKEYEFQRLDASLVGSHYELPEGKLKLNSYFRVMASEMADGNALYIFSIKPDGSSELLFPTKRENNFGISLTDDPIILDEDSYIEVPTKRAFKADQPGDDSLIFLYSKHELEDPDQLVHQIAGESGEIEERLNAVLGDRLVPKEDISFDASSMQFSGKSSRGTIVPIVLKVTIKP